MHKISGFSYRLYHDTYVRYDGLFARHRGRQSSIKNLNNKSLQQDNPSVE